MSSPEGGAKDVQPPQILSTTPPNKSLEFDAKEIIIELDEYFSLQNFSSQFFTSPPLEKKVDQKIKGVKLYLTLNDTLKPNTTYTFNFGNSIVDITENNAQKNFKYVFSTGKMLDSLTISGKAADAYTGENEAAVVAMLYSAHRGDSAVYNAKPDYYAITEENGSFLIENLAQDTFLLYVLKDENFNLKYDPGSDKIGFVESVVVAGQADELNIKTFHEQKEVALNDARLAEYGHIEFSFSTPITEPVISLSGAIEELNNKETVFIRGNTKGDTVHYWFNPEALPKEMRTAFFDFKSTAFEKDSIRVLLRDIKKPKLNAQFVKKNIFTPRDSITIKCLTPIVSVDPSKFFYVKGEDTLHLEVKQNDLHNLTCNLPLKLTETYHVFMLSEAITDMFGSVNDSTFYKVQVASEDELATLRIRLTAADSVVKIAQLTNKEGKPLKEYYFYKSLKVDLDHMAPGTYGMRIIWDTNENQQWDTGILLDKKQPELVKYYPKPIELRVNWELEVAWDIPITQD